MATLVFGSLGSMLGGPLGVAIGSLIGRQFDGALFGAPNRNGPRLKELAVTTSSYGQTIPRLFGRMRTSGSVIWATELVERSEVRGSGKGGPSITAYSYAANFAVALASRPIRAIGRIWADGQLLRGTEGDLKTAGTLRIHTGAGDQLPDPLMAAAEGLDRCPAHRGIAYVVFEGLDLSGFHNRIPSLTFEVVADDDFGLHDIIGSAIDDVDANMPLAQVLGYTSEQSPAADLQAFSQVMPLEIDAAGTDLVVARARGQAQAVHLAEPAIATDDDDFGAASGFARHRGPPAAAAPAILRYYDVDRDFQPSLQRAAGRALSGEPTSLELPAALASGTARAMIETVSRRLDWSRDRISWRTCELRHDVGPGSLVVLPGITGHWRVVEWEWRESGVELTLERALPTSGAAAPAQSSDPGRANPASDLPAAPTQLVALELPYDPALGSPDVTRTVAAVSSPGAGWSGAAMYADRGDGALLPLGPSGRRRATIGTVQSVLRPISPLIVDRGAGFVVSLIDPAMTLADADMPAIDRGANLALVGEEIVQFLHAVPLGEGRWRLQGLLRGRGGTEHAVGTHVAGETFALLDAGLVTVDSATIGADPGRQVVSLGRGDLTAASSPVHLAGIGLCPMAPVHPRRLVGADGSWTFHWTRRARGGWAWQSGVDAPLVEQAERYLITLGPLDAPMASWSTDTPELRLEAGIVAQLAASVGATLHVRQQGTHALSAPLPLLTLV